MTNPEQKPTQPTQPALAATVSTEKAQTVPAGSLATLVSGGDKTVAANFSDPSAPSTAFSGQVWGDFKVGELLGKGGMGSVFKGRQLSLDRSVAIKVLPAHLSEDAQFRDRFALEAKAVAQISSPNVIQVYGAGQHQGHHYFAMEFVEGTDLSRRLRDGYRPTYEQALDLVTQAARGLAAAGEHGIIHRDIKPGNMMITPKGVLKIMDFGLVKLASTDTGMTMAGTIMGTVNYFSPEQGRGERCDQRTDIYALGIVFYELLTRTLPFTGTDPTSIIYQHIHQAPRKPKEIDPNIPEDYQAVVLKCLQKNADDRYASAEEMLHDLDCLRRGVSPATAFQNPLAMRRGGSVVRKALFRREKRRLAALAAIGCAAGGGAWYWSTLDAQDKQKLQTIIPAVLQQSDNGAAQADIRKRTAAGDFSGARKLVEPRLRDHPDDASWKELAQEIDRAEGERELKNAQEALQKKDFDRAGRAAVAAQSLVPESPELKAVLEQLQRHEGGERQRARTLNEATNLMNEGKPDKAVELLQPQHDASPEDVEIANALRLATKMRDEADAVQAAVRDNLEKGDQAMSRRDYDAAQLAYSMARQSDPKSIRAKDGLDKVTAIKTAIEDVRGKFQVALKDRDLGAAEKQLAELRSLAPGSAVLVLAEAEMERSKLIDEDKRRRHSDLEAQMSAKAKDVLLIVSDSKRDVPEMEKALADFVRDNGADRPERAMLEEKIEDRRQLARLTQALAGLDAAMLHQDAKGVAALVRDHEFAAALTELMAMPGLVFEERVDDFQRQGTKAVAKISLRHALTTFPERNLSYQYDLEQSGDDWVIAKARLQQ